METREEVSGFEHEVEVSGQRWMVVTMRALETKAVRAVVKRGGRHTGRVVVTGRVWDAELGPRTNTSYHL